MVHAHVSKITCTYDGDVRRGHWKGPTPKILTLFSYTGLNFITGV